jgi:hypothetical protein
MLWIPGVVSPEVERPEHETDNSLSSSTEVKNAWSYTTTPPYVLMARRLIKDKDSIIFFTFTLAAVLFGWGVLVSFCSLT